MGQKCFKVLIVLSNSPNFQLRIRLINLNISLINLLINVSSLQGLVVKIDKYMNLCNKNVIKLITNWKGNRLPTCK